MSDQTATATQTPPANPGSGENFRPPAVHRGQQVIFYPRAIINASTRVLGTVQSSNHRTAEINVNGRIWEGAHHVEDPILQTKPRSREFGAWEICPRDREIDDKLSRFDELEHRVCELEQLLYETTSSSGDDFGELSVSSESIDDFES